MHLKGPVKVAGLHPIAHTLTHSPQLKPVKTTVVETGGLETALLHHKALGIHKYFM